MLKPHAPTRFPGAVLAAALTAAALVTAAPAAALGGVAAQRIVYTGACPTWCGLRIVHGDGTGDAPLTADAGDGDAAWSADGTRLAFSRTVNGVPTIVTMNADGTNPVPLAAGGHPTWNADGTKLAFVRGPSIWTMSSNGTSQRRITSPGVANGAYDFDPAWSRDGSRIVAVRFNRNAQGDTTRLLTMRPDGSDRRVAYSFFRHFGSLSGSIRSPEWSPDGTRIAFTMSVLGFTVAEAVNSNGLGNAFPAIVRARTYEPSWSRCTRIAAAIGADSRGLDPTPGGLYTMLPDGTGLTRIGDGSSPTCWEP